jgi:uncharacterized membrane protein YdjX (TVP38/TMEM64 family)
MAIILPFLVTAHAFAGAASASVTSPGVIGPFDRTTAHLPSSLVSLNAGAGNACHGRGAQLFSSVTGSSRALFGSRKSSCAHLSLSAPSLATSIPRGGGIQLRQSNDNESVADGGNEDAKKKKIRNALVAVSVLSMVVWKKDFLIGALQSIKGDFDLKQFLIDKLDTLAGYGNTGLVVYTIVFALYEILVGMTTPVETAAGMAFGVKNGIICNAIGKMGGAVLAFLIGRFLLFDYFTEKLEGNEMMELVQESIQENPIRVALIWRFSFLPEQIKTFGLSVLPVSLLHYVTAVVLHGFPFTCLWTAMGAEAGALARGTVTSPSNVFKVLVVGIQIFGFFISPTMVGLWVKSLKDRQNAKKKGA